MTKKSCTYCDSTNHQTGSCPHLPHGDSHRVEKPAAYRRTSHKAPNAQNLPRDKSEKA